MKMAVATTGLDRLKWVQIAQAWHDLEAARVRFSSPSGLMNHFEFTPLPHEAERRRLQK